MERGVPFACLGSPMHDAQLTLIALLAACPIGRRADARFTWYLKAKAVWSWTGLDCTTYPGKAKAVLPYRMHSLVGRDGPIFFGG